jgi:hypothetical protein
MTDSSEPVLLDADIESAPERYDHPLDLTLEEAEQGHALWLAVDDLDDESNGIDRPGLRTASPGRAEAMRRARIFKRCLLEAGVPEVSIELQDGRPDNGDTWNLCRPVMGTSHHIVSSPSPLSPTPGLALVKRGRSDLPGPLANGHGGVDLVYRILTMGMANHPGEGGPLTVRGPLGAYTIPRDVARPYAWGTEYEGGLSNAVWDRVYTNARTGQQMSFREFMGRCNAGIVRAIWLINGHGKNPGAAGELDLSGYHGEHKTWAPGRKPDRMDYTTESGRAEIRKYNDGGDDDVSAKDVWEYKIKPLWDNAKAIPAHRMLAQAHKRAGESRSAAKAAEVNSAAALRQAKANREAIKQIVTSLDASTSSLVIAALGPDLDDEVARAEDFPDEVDEA